MIAVGKSMKTKKDARRKTETLVSFPLGLGLLQRMKWCRECQLCKERTQVVPGFGARSARLFLLGEAPGEIEDRDGLPFVGPAGDLLDDMLFEAGILRERIYIANVVACRPPGNRKPRPEEIAACGEFVQEQLLLVAPKVIIAMGATAAMWFGLSGSISYLRQTSSYSWHGARLFVSYHPAHILRNPGARDMFVADVGRAGRIAEGVERCRSF